MQTQPPRTLIQVQVCTLSAWLELCSLNFGCPCSSDEKEDLEKTVQALRTEVADSQHKYNSLVQRLQTELVNSQQNADSLSDILNAHPLERELEHGSEASSLCADSHATDTGEGSSPDLRGHKQRYEK